MTPGPGILELATRFFRLHAWAYGVAVLLALTQALRSVEWWFFWPLMVWTVLFLLHFLVVKSLGVSNDWVAERAEKTAKKAFDISHIESIRESYEKSVSRSGTNEPADGAEAGASDAAPEPDETLKGRP